MSQRRFSIPFIVVVGGTVATMAGLLLFFVVGCIAAPLDVYLGVPPAATFTVLFGGPVLLTVLAAARHGLRRLPWTYRGAAAVVGLTTRFLVGYWWQRRHCRGTAATPLARFSVRHATEAETALSRSVTSRALVALFDDPDPDIRSRAAGHFRARVDGAGVDRVWELAEDVSPEAANRVLTELLDADRKPRPDAIEYAWRLWLSQGDEELLTALATRQLVPPGSLKRLAELVLGLREPAEQLEAATDPTVPSRARRHVAEGCCERGTAPTDPVAAATFLLLSGNLDRYRRLDFDGSLLPLVYRQLHPAERVQLRTVLTELGELDLLRRVRSRHDGDPLSDSAPRPVGVEESRRLWRALLGESLLEAVRHVDRLEHWTPDDAHDRELLHRLRAHDFEELSRRLSELETVPDRELELPDTPVSFVAAAVSPEGDRLTMAVLERWQRFLEFDTATGRLLANWSGVVTSTVSALVHTDSGLAVLHIGSERVLEHFRPPRSADEEPKRRVLATGAANDLRTVRPHRDGFVVAGHDTLQLRDHDGEVLDSLIADSDDPRGIRALDCDPSSGRIAVGTGRWVRVHHPDPNARLVVDNWSTPPDAIVMLDDATLVKACALPDGVIDVSRWTVTDGKLTLRTSRRFDMPPGISRFFDSIVMYRWGPTGVLVTSAPSSRTGGGGLAIDTRSMTALPSPLAADERILAAADGRDFVTRVAVDGRDRFLVRRLGPSPLTGLFDTPLSQLDLADLHTVERELRLLSKAPPVELLRDCLRHRFAAEIALGESGPVGTDYDVGLGEDR